MAAPDATVSKPCAICGRPVRPQFRLFCSRRCADVDLNRWLSGAYRVPGDPDEGTNTGDTPPDPAGRSHPGQADDEPL